MITLPRGNSRDISIELKSGGEPYALKGGEKLIFTVKQFKSRDADDIIQKVMTADDIEDGLYIVRLKPEDTINMEPGTYFFDIAIAVNEDFYTIIKVDKFIITDALSDKEDAYG